jgi:hypothetical protein
MTTDPLFGKKKWLDTELEKDFQARVADLLHVYGWSVFSIPDSRRATVSGWPDICAWNVKLGRIIWVELKREKGLLSEAQKQVLSDLGLLGLENYVWRPSDWDDIVKIAKGTK